MKRISLIILLLLNIFLMSPLYSKTPEEYSQLLMEARKSGKLNYKDLCDFQINFLSEYLLPVLGEGAIFDKNMQLREIAVYHKESVHFLTIKYKTSRLEHKFLRIHLYSDKVTFSYFGSWFESEPPTEIYWQYLNFAENKEDFLRTMKSNFEKTSLDLKILMNSSTLKIENKINSLCN